MIQTAIDDNLYMHLSPNHSAFRPETIDPRDAEFHQKLERLRAQMD